MKYGDGYKAFVASKKFKMRKKLASVDDLDLPELVSEGLDNAGGFRRLLESLPKDRTLSREADHHNSLSDVIRLKILWALDASELCPCVLKRVTRVSDSKVSYHLNVLEKAGLIRARRTRSWRVYFITPSGKSALGEARRRIG